MRVSTGLCSYLESWAGKNLLLCLFRSLVEFISLGPALACWGLEPTHSTLPCGLLNMDASVHLASKESLSLDYGHGSDILSPAMFCWLGVSYRPCLLSQGEDHPKAWTGGGASRGPHWGPPTRLRYSFPHWRLCLLAIMSYLLLKWVM